MLLLQHDGAVGGATWNQDETQILTWSEDGTARLWDATTGDLLYTLLHSNAVYGATWSQDETQVLTWSEDGTARLWDASNGTSLQIFEHSSSVTRAIWDQNETLVMTTTFYATTVWDCETGDRQLTLPYKNIGVTPWAFLLSRGAIWSHDETRILTWGEGDDGITIWDAVNGNELFNAYHINYLIFGAQWSIDDTRVFTWSGDGTLRIWDTTAIENRNNP